MMFLRVSRGAAMLLGMMLLVCVSASVSAHESEETSSELVNYLIVSSEYNDEPACRTNKGEGDFESAFYPVELPRNECFELCDELNSCVSLSVFTQREETACMLYFRREDVPSVLPKLHGIAPVIDESFREVSPKEFYYESSEGFDLAACYKKLPSVPKKRLRHRSRRSKTDSETS